MPIWSINIIIFAILMSGFTVLFFKPKIDKNIKLMFLFYLFFWLPVSLLRPYTANLWRGAGLDPKTQVFLIYVSMYGLIGVITRWLSTYTTFKIRSRRSYLAFAMFIQIATFLPCFFVQNTASLYMQMIGTAFAAGGLGIFNLMVREQGLQIKIAYGITLFALPPLIADLFASPIQALISSYGKNHNPIQPGDDVNALKYLWLVALIPIFIAFIIMFFVKENKVNFIINDKNKIVGQRKKSYWFYLIFISIIGLFITFAKFGTSGAIATTHLGIIDKNNAKNYAGYLNAVFSTGQIIGGLGLGFFIAKTNKKLVAMLIGLSIWIFYYIICMFVHVGPVFIAVHSLNGLGYGIVYNLGILLIIELVTNNEYTKPMGVYQTVAAIGITSSTYLGFWLKRVVYNTNQPLNLYFKYMYIQYGLLIGVTVLIMILFTIYIFLNKDGQSNINYTIKKQENAIIVINNSASK